MNASEWTGAALASWWVRAAAALLDSIIVGAVSGVLGAAISTGRNVQLVLASGLTIVYATVLIGGTAGRTLGMRAIGIRCCVLGPGRQRADAPVGYGRALGRAVLAAVLEATVVFGLVDLLWPLWDPRRQTLHDKAASTVVIVDRPADGP
jgi:uncharacterized RDD family membrane protein YckC